MTGIFPGNLEPSTTIAGCIDVFESVWPDPEGTIEKIENECRNPDSDLNWQRASTTGYGQNQNIRTNYDLCVTSAAEIYGNELAKNIHNQMYFLLLAAAGSYRTKYAIDENLNHEYYSVLKYSGGQYYNGHYDGATSSRRSVSAIVYLNSDYDGGEIEFVNFKVKIKPEPGMLLLFPSNYAYRHIAHPVLDGTKYGIVTWLQDQ